MARILVVDDEPNNRLLLATILELGGYVVAEAADGAEALLAANAERPDLIVLDLHMPGMSGFDVIKALRADPLLATVKVALYTATAPNPELQVLIDAAGVQGVIPKPSEPREVLDIVGRIVQGR